MHCDLELSQELEGHQKAVRCLTVLKNGTVCSGGVDNLVCLFKQIRNDEGKLIRFELEKRLHHHTDMVYAVADSGGDSKFFYSGGKEKVAYKLDYDGNPHKQFVGHDGPVCSISEQSSDRLLTGSWDGTFRIWDMATTQQIAKVDAGTHAITICCLPTGDIATGSQEASIKIWSSDGLTLKHTLTGHTDIIRKLVVNTKSNTLLSCSNDQMIKIWSTDGLEMGSLLGHEGFVFDLCLNGDSTALYSSADDRLLKVWNVDTSSCSQSILHPNTIWGVALLPGCEDIVTACADGVVRIWSSDPTRIADDAIRDKFRNEALNKAAEASKQGAGIPLDSVPHESEIPRTRGKKAGEIKMFKTDSNVINAYSWNGGGWDLLGEVTGKGKTSYAGDQFFPAGDYDYVFDVELGENGSTVKLPYNEGENQLVVAEKICARENINKGMLEQITAFLRQQTGSNGAANKPKTIEQQGGAGGAAANGSATATSSSTAAQNMSSSAGGGGPQAGKLKHFPVLDALFFDTGKPEAAEKKILEFNDALNDGDTEKKMDHIEKMHFNEAIQKLQKKHGSKDMRAVERDLIWRKCGGWDEDKLFPVLDLWRLYLLRADSCEMFKGTDRGYSIIQSILRMLKSNLNTPLGIGCARCLANIFSSFTNRASLFERRVPVLQVLKEAAMGGQPMHKQVKLALTTTLLNFTTAFIGLKEKTGRTECIETCESFLTAVLKNGGEADDHEATYRVLDLDHIHLKKTSSLAGTMTSVMSTCGDARCKEAVTDIQGLMK